MNEERDTLPLQERYEAAIAREQDAGYEPDRPSAEEAAERPESDPKWPLCRTCRRMARGGLPCTSKRCPWRRVDDHVIDPAAFNEEAGW
jgi:hypothetical protein